jgi:hypothetical protein
MTITVSKLESTETSAGVKKSKATLSMVLDDSPFGWRLKKSHRVETTNIAYGHIPLIVRKMTVPQMVS